MTRSPRYTALATIRRLATEVRGGAYFVKRGPIDWSSFPFTKHERALAIMVDEQTLFQSINTATVTLEVAGQLSNPEDQPELNDGLMDEFTEDLEWIARSLMNSTDDQGDSVITGLNLKDATAIEFHDPQFGVQGMILNFNITY